jgi:DNA repair exonuclease SbcCD ATPase subunit
MHSNIRFLISILFLAVPLLAFADGTDDQEKTLDRNRRLLEKWKSDPQHYARLRQDLEAFLALPEEKQNALRKLDHDLHEEDSSGYARLQRVLERYADWLERLPEADRKRVEAARDSKERVQLIKQIRQREWIGLLPSAYQEELAKLESDPAKYQQRVKELREDERKRRAEWRTARQHWNEVQRPGQLVVQLQKLGPEIEAFVKQSLTPYLSPAEEKRLKTDFEAAKSKQQWGSYLTAVVELADKHPIMFPPSPGAGRPTKPSDLPSDMLARLQKSKNWPSEEVKRAEGKWPDFPLAVVKFARENPSTQVLKYQLGPAHLNEFSPSVQKFYNEKLWRELKEDEKDLIKKAEGHWPRYPRQLMALSKKHNLRMPGMALPGQAYLWEPFRQRIRQKNDIASGTVTQRLPDVPDKTLREFMRKDMTQEERAALPMLSLDNPETRELVLRAYFEKNPDVQQRLLSADQNKQQRKGKGLKKP